MTTINLGSIETNGESTAVAAGKEVIAALGAAGAVEIDGWDSVGEDVWSELTQHLGRRGVEINDRIATRTDAE